jgi:hypothetical protein
MWANPRSLARAPCRAPNFQRWRIAFIDVVFADVQDRFHDVGEYPIRAVPRNCRDLAKYSIGGAARWREIGPGAASGELYPAAKSLGAVTCAIRQRLRHGVSEAIDGVWQRGGFDWQHFQRAMMGRGPKVLPGPCGPSNSAAPLRTARSRLCEATTLAFYYRTTRSRLPAREHAEQCPWHSSSCDTRGKLEAPPSQCHSDRHPDRPSCRPRA